MIDPVDDDEVFDPPGQIEFAADVDAKARFPRETVDALKKAKLLSAPIPRELGGAGYGMRELAALCSALAQGCGSSAMVLAMHYIQVACIARHAQTSAYFRGYLQELVEHQYLLASMTSENGTFGETRTSICAVERTGDRFKLDKDATTGSYCQHADGILVTCRRGPESQGAQRSLRFGNLAGPERAREGRLDAGALSVR